MNEAYYCDEKILVSAEPDAMGMPGGIPGGVSVDTVPEQPRMGFVRRHRKTLKMIATLFLIVIMASGIAGGVIWKLQGMCSVKCD